MSLEDDLIALEQRVLLQTAGDFLAAVEQLRQMLVRGTPGIGAKLISLAIPELEQAAKAGVAEGFQLGAADALTSAELLPHVEGPGDNALGDARQRLQTFPERLSDPLSGIDRFVFDAKTKAVVLHTSGARIEESLAPIFQASNAIVSRVSTSINAAGNEAVLEVGDAVDGPLVWQAERDACVYCLALAGEVVQSGAQFPKADLYADPPASQGLVTRPALHPHCLPGDAIVTPGSGITGASSRIFEGEMVRVRTLSGKELSATPNHPVLTDRGWVALGLLRVGDRVLSRSGTERPITRYSNGQHVPAPIGEVAEAVLSSSKMSTAEVPMSTVDFHGDGTEGEVAHVATDLHLPAEHLSSRDQQTGEPAFEVAGQVLAGSIGRSDSLSMDFGLHAAANGSVSSVRKPGSLLWRTVRHALEHRRGTVAWLDAALEQSSADGGSADPEAVGDALLALAGEVVADELVDVERYAFHGPVYNIETETGWYIGNGIIVHNCRCTLALLGDASYADALKREAQRSILRGFALPTESNAVRVRAAARLLDRDPIAPKSVKAYATRAVKAGKFPTRDVPDGGPRLVVK